jgi:hypothetical protein
LTGAAAAARRAIEKLARNGKQANVVGRELAGFVWAIARRVPGGGLIARNP